MRRTVWLDPWPAAAELGVIYPHNYYAYTRSKNVSPIVRKGKEVLDRIKFNGFLKRTGIPAHTGRDSGGRGRHVNPPSGQS